MEVAYTPYVAVASTTVLYGSTLYMLRRTRNGRLDPRVDLNVVTDVHSCVATAAALYALNGRWIISQGTDHITGQTGRYLDDSQNPIIHGKSWLGNAITGLETGYLVYDTLAILLLRYYSTGSLKGLNGAFRRFASHEPITFVHHLALNGALGYLQTHIAASKERGVWIINAFSLMNASTPLLHWRWLRRHRTGCNSLSLDLAFACIFAVCRLHLPVWILQRYGAFHGITALDAFLRQRLVCKIGTATLLGMNILWWLVLAHGVLRRSAREVLLPGGQPQKT